MKRRKGLNASRSSPTPVSAPTLGTEWLEIDGVQMPCRASLGLLTQPISFIGLPVAAVPVGGSPLPIAVQLIAAPCAF